MDYRLRIKELCKQKGITQKVLAERLGITDIGLGKSLRGSPNIATFERIADALSVPIAALFDQPATGNFTCPSCGAAIKLTAEKA